MRRRRQSLTVGDVLWLAGLAWFLALLLAVVAWVAS